MGKKRRGRERLVRCSGCGRQMPRDKCVNDMKRRSYSTDLKEKGAENVSFSDFVEVSYCISCGKHRGIFEKKKQQAQRRRENRYGSTF
ncbi:MAG: hypothetical protein V1492_06170 [Candidatus Micrarchaeota archaeon]